MKRKNVRLAQGLTYAGILPFALLSAALILRLQGGEYRLALCAYGAVILSFISGTHWAAFLFFADRCKNNLLIRSNLVALFGWLTVLPGLQAYGWAMQSLGFGYLLLIDHDLYRAQLLPAWFFRLRRNATIIVGVLLLAAADRPVSARIAIIGAGLSGLTLANRLAAQADVTVFEKARGVGGRMSTRYAEPFCFDHGAQFFTARDDDFQQFIAPHLVTGLVQDWRGKVVTLAAGKPATDRLWFEPHYVAVPAMNSLCKHLAATVRVNLNCEIAPLSDRMPDGWRLHDKAGAELGRFDLVISTAPPVQTCRLFGDHLPAGAALRRGRLLACYTLMLGYRREWAAAWIAAKIHDSPLEWMAVNSSKPGRDRTLTALVINSSNVWAEAHCDDDLATTELLLRAELQRVLPLDLGAPLHSVLHRWRYALLDRPLGDQSRQAPYYDAGLRLASTGDWCRQSRIEDSWLAGQELADQILADL